MPTEFIDFIVRIKKEGEKTGLIGEFTYIEDEFHIFNITFSEDIEHDLVHCLHSKKYTGPEFNTLDELFQKRFGEFFENMGINEKLAHFLINYSTNKDQKLYYNWLKEINNFI